MKILITGALGHIGSSLFRKLEKNKKISKIYLVDNLLSQRYCSLFSVPKSKKFHFINLNLSSCKLEDIPKANIVIHLAAKTDAAQSASFEKEFYSNNLQTTKKMIKYCKKNVSKLIFASSTSVYGPQSLVVDEDCHKSELNPQSPYANIKLYEEKLIAKNLKKEKFIILRLGTIYGYSPGIRFHTAVNKFCFNASINTNINVYKTALHQYRPYLSLKDAFKVFKFCIEKNFFHNDIFNVLSGNYTVNQIITKIRKYKKNINIKLVKSQIMNQLSYHVSQKKINRYGLILNSNIERDIRDTIKLLRNI